MKFSTKGFAFEATRIAEVGAKIQPIKDPHDVKAVHEHEGKTPIVLEWKKTPTPEGASERVALSIAEANQRKQREASRWLEPGVSAAAGDVVTADGLVIPAALIEFFCEQ